MKHTDPAEFIATLTDGLNTVDDVLAFVETRQMVNDPRLPALLANSSLLLQTCHLFTRRAGAFWKGALAAGFTLEELASLIDVPVEDIQKAIDADTERKVAKENWAKTGDAKERPLQRPGQHHRKQTPKRRRK